MRLEELQALLRTKEANLEELEYKHYQMRAELEEETYQLQSKTRELQELLEEKHAMARRFLYQEEADEEIVTELCHRVNRQFESWLGVLEDAHYQAKVQLNRKQEDLEEEFRHQRYCLQQEIDDLHLQKRRL